MMSSDQERDPQTSRYHLDKRINVGIILAIALAILTGIGNAVSLAWFLSGFATSTTYRQQEMERRISLNEQVTHKLSEAQAAMAQNIAVNAETTRQIVSILAKLEAKVDQPPRVPIPGTR